MIRDKRYRVASIVLSLVILLTAGLAYPSGTNAAGSGPNDALQLTGDWAQLGAAESRWYTFWYAGDGSQIEVQLQTEPEGSAGFALWTPEEIWSWGLGEYVEPVGRGSAAPNTTGMLVWSGSFPTPGIYYVVVENSSAGECYYQLDVSGSGVSLSEPESMPTPEPVVVQEEATEPGEPAGTLVFQTTYGGTFYTANVDGTGLRPVTSGMDPVWSPDGEQIAFVRWEEPRGVWVVDAEGTDEHLLFAWHEARYPSWSPDGQEIVVSRQHRGHVEEYKSCVNGPNGQFCRTRPPNPHYSLGVVRVEDGSFYEPLPSTSERSLTPDWSPDGDSMVYQDVYGLYVQSADGQTRYQLTGGNLDTTPAWSPDGSQVAYVHRQHDHWEIYVVDVATGQQVRLTDTPALPSGTAADSVSPAWSPDGSYIAFLTNRTGEWEIWVMGADGGNQEPLFDAELDGLTIQYAFAGERAIDWTW